MKSIIFYSLFSIFCLVGCVSTGLKNFDQIKEGMDKDGVLELLGNPIRTEKSSTSEKWAYHYFAGENKEVEVLKYVHFINGRVVSYGNDVEEQKRLDALKASTEKNEAHKKLKEEVEEKVEKAYEKKDTE